MKHFSLFTLGIYLFDMTYIDSAYPASDSIIETEQRTNQMNNLLRIISDLQVSCNYGQFLSTKYNYCWCNVIIYCMWISWKYLMLFFPSIISYKLPGLILYNTTEFDRHMYSPHRSFGHVTTCAEVSDVSAIHWRVAEICWGRQLQVSYAHSRFLLQ